MTRDGPGFLVDLIVLWGTLSFCLIMAGVFVGSFGRPWGFVPAIAVGVVVVFIVLVAYYRVFLDETPLLGTANRSRFAVLASQLVIVGILFGALFGPTDPTVQNALFGLVVLSAVGVSYWVVYRREPSTA